MVMLSQKNRQWDQMKLDSLVEEASSSRSDDVVTEKSALGSDEI